MHEILAVLRYVVFGAFALALFAATGSWLVRTQRVSPFSALGRFLRRASEPFIAPVETKLLRTGGNPVHAGWWLVIAVALVGVVLLSLLEWLARTGRVFFGAIRGGPGAVAFFLVNLAYSVLVFALLARVIASWFGVFRYSRWIRPAYWLTDWLVNPIRRLLPPVGMFDLSPIVAWIALWVLRQFALRVLLA